MVTLPAKYDVVRRARILVMESHETPFWGDARQIVAVLEEANANAIRFPATAWAVTYFPSSILPPYPGLGERDLLGEMLEAAEGTGITVIPYNHVGVFHTSAYRLHPDWAATDYDGHPLRWPSADWDGGFHYTTCLTNPGFRDAYCQAMAELVQRYDVDAMYFDGPVWYVVCQCQHCRRAFEEAYGRQLPRMPSNTLRQQASWPGWRWEDETWLDWFQLRYRTCEAFMAQLNRAVKSVKDIPVVFNSNVEQMGARSSGSLQERVMEYAEGSLSTEVTRLANALPGQLTSSGGTYAGIIAQTKIGVAMGKAAWCYCPPAPHLNLSSDDSLDTLIYGYSYLAIGGTPITKPVHGFLHDRDGVAQIRRLHDIARRLEPYFYDFEPMPHVSLNYNRATGDFYGREDPEGRFSQHWHGAFRALTYSHQQLMPSFDHHLCRDALAGIRVLYLENVACLSEEQAEAIRRFVAAGGGLVATYETSLYDERGHKRSNFALSDVFGLDYLSSIDWEGVPASRAVCHEVLEGYLRVTAESPLTEGIRLDKNIFACSRHRWSSHGQMALTSPREADVGAVAEMYLPVEGAYGAPFRFPYGRPPGVATNRYGEGRVVYFAPAMGRLYFRWGDELVRRLIANAVHWAGHGSEPFRIDAPSGVMAHLTQERDGHRRLLHLINCVGNRYENGAHRIDYVAPLTGIEVKVRLPDGRSAGRVSELVSGESIPFVEEGGFVSFTLPRLDMFASLLVDC